MLLLTWLLSALAAPVCESPAPVQRDRLSVAWISPTPARATARQWLTVIPAAELRRWVAEEQADLTRLLQGLGLRRSDAPPHRPWKVVVFDVEADELCRPTREGTPGTDAGGVPICASGGRGVRGRDRGCGYVIDRADESRGPDVFRIQWAEAAVHGFCVLPVDRFLEGR